MLLTIFSGRNICIMRKMRKEQIPEKHDFFPKQCQTYTLIHLKLYLLFWCFILVM